MKNVSHILASLRRKPQFSKLARFACIQRIQGLFPPHLQSLIRYGYIHNNILYFVLSHPGARQEFDLIIGSIKGPLKQYTPPECKALRFDDIRAYVKHLPPEPPRAEGMQTVPHYRERARGQFINPIRDKALHDAVERIRETIKKRNDH